MPRFIWVAAGAVVMALALTPGTALAVSDRSHAAGSSSSRAIEHHRGLSPGAGLHRRRRNALAAGRGRRRRNAPEAGRHRAVAVLGPGSGYQQAGVLVGSGCCSAGWRSWGSRRARSTGFTVR